MINEDMASIRGLALLSAVNPLAPYSNCYPLLLIPAGALLYLAMKKLSDVDALNKGISITTCDEPGRIEVIRMDERAFLSILERVRKMNDGMLAIRSMAVRLGELATAMMKETGKNLQESDAYTGIVYLIHSHDNKNVTLLGDFICSTDTPYKEVIARSLYEEALINNSFRAKNKVGFAKFLESIRAICLSDLNLKLLLHHSRNGHTTVNMIEKSELCELAISETLYAKGNALLLFLELSHIVAVSKCWGL